MDRELQIELTKLQIKHEHEISEYTITLSVFISLLVAIVSIYVPLSVLTGNFIYSIIATAYFLVSLYPIRSVLKKMRLLDTRLDTEILELKKKYL